MAEQQQAQAAAQQQLNMLMMSMIQQLAQQTGAVLSQLPIPGAPQLSQPVPPPFTSTGAPYFTTVAPVGTTALPVSTAPTLYLVSVFSMTSLLSPSVAEPVSASVAQPARPVSTLPAATPAQDVGPCGECYPGIPMRRPKVCSPGQGGPGRSNTDGPHQDCSLRKTTGSFQRNRDRIQSSLYNERYSCNQLGLLPVAD